MDGCFVGRFFIFEVTMLLSEGYECHKITFTFMISIHLLCIAFVLHVYVYNFLYLKYKHV